MGKVFRSELARADNGSDGQIISYCWVMIVRAVPLRLPSGGLLRLLL